jgi:hypothetical protein
MKRVLTLRSTIFYWFIDHVRQLIQRRVEWQDSKVAANTVVA